MKGFKNIILFLFAFSFTFMLIILIDDYIEFHQLMGSNYKTPWYDTFVLNEPYTNLMLAGKPSKEYWIKNATGDDWHIREIQYKDKVFWTVLKKVNNE